MKRIVYQVDSFTRERFRGNPAGVVVNADGMTENQMLQVARELNNSETAFLFSSDSDDCDAVIRYFTPNVEVPTCGHATIAAMYVKAIEEGLGSCTLRLKTNIGVLPIEIIKEDNDYRIIMTQGKFELSQPLGGEVTTQLLAALGLTPADREEGCPVQIASTGHSKVMIGIKSRSKLNGLTPNFSALADLSRVIGSNGYFVFTFDSDCIDTLTYGRMFAPAIGINEDPVTGNANGPLGGYLIEHKLVEWEGTTFEFNGKQGEQIGRLGSIGVKVKIIDGKPQSIQIKGDAVIIFKTEITI